MMVVARLRNPITALNKVEFALVIGGEREEEAKATIELKARRGLVHHFFQTRCQDVDGNHCRTHHPPPKYMHHPYLNPKVYWN